MYFSFLGVYEQHFPRLQPPFFPDFTRLEPEYSGFAGHYHYPCLGYEISGRAESVPVQHPSCIPPVREEQCGRTVPRFHQDGVVFIEGFQVFAYRVLVIEGLGYEHGHGVRKTHSGHHEKFQHIVQ